MYNSILIDKYYIYESPSGFKIHFSSSYTDQNSPNSETKAFINWLAIGIYST